MSTILKCNNISKRFKNFYALENANFNIESGRIVGLLGPNGSGKSTFIKLATGLLTPEQGNITINDLPIGYETKKIVSYLPERTYLNEDMKVHRLVDMFNDFFEDFDKNKAYEMLQRLNINPNDNLKKMSKGTKEKVQLILVMSRNAMLYLLDEPIGGVDPAARDYILNTILTNYNENSSILISTHLISDIEQIIDDVIFIQNSHIILTSSVDSIREEKGMSVDEYFREVFRC